MGLVGVESAVRHLQYEPTTNGIEPPEVIDPTYKIIAAFSKLFLLNAAL
jgi:hypothetical protein